MQRTSQPPLVEPASATTHQHQHQHSTSSPLCLVIAISSSCWGGGGCWLECLPLQWWPPGQSRAAEGGSARPTLDRPHGKRPFEAQQTILSIQHQFWSRLTRKGSYLSTRQCVRCPSERSRSRLQPETGAPCGSWEERCEQGQTVPSRGGCRHSSQVACATAKPTATHRRLRQPFLASKARPRTGEGSTCVLSFRAPRCSRTLAP
jgi:hypothetical protein